ncbi:MAG: hypothetical protein QGG48_04020, partial [Desulfatiglandales bacterium]|nr:hypothetical protein [Desulfatiglandales bacterium]
MSSITIFSGAFCHGGEVARKMAQSLGSELLFDGALISQTSERFQMSESKIHRTLFEKPSVFNKFTHCMSSKGCGQKRNEKKREFDLPFTISQLAMQPLNGNYISFVTTSFS